ncbi:hypothetical protein FisN_19Lh130 [Fistulifera solaris]|uniref:Uncharacterized protein n=1 Tax=Fistulifera solaris TaxID=1519565 RepID=A0A1Z5J6P0_FISSO|nr:hypothetical protein FisN_19Lh130 [Fistulifera solaris]|eukprot:GAX09663.1 hypothetical protein FisN_19Lh130 [Fistulifera solaris]
MAKSSSKKTPSKQGKEKPPLRRSPRKQEATTPSKINYSSESSQSDNGGGKEAGSEHPKTYSDEFIGSLTDMVEYYAERLLMSEREERLELYNTFQEYWQIHPMKHHEFGSLYARYLITNCVFATCIGSPYPCTTDNDNNDDDDEEEETIMPMISLSRNNWSQIKTEFKNLRDLAIRNDTKNKLNFYLDDAVVRKLCNPDDINPQWESEKLFKGSHDRLQKRFEIQEAVAPIRARLEVAVANQKEPSVRQADIDDILEFLEGTRYEGVDDVVLSLFDTESLNSRAKLKPWTELKDILQTKYFSLHYLQEMAEKLLQEWNREIFGDRPFLVKKKYRMADGDYHSDSTYIARTASERRLQALKRKREILNKYHGDDPLEESRRIAAQARGARVRDEGSRDKDVPVRDVHVRERSDHEEDEQHGDNGNEEEEEEEIVEDDEQEEVGPLELSGLPPRKKMYVKIYRGAEPDEDVYTADGRVKKRRPWSDREIGALKKGVAKFGKGCWAEIKNEYAEILRNRTTVQIKDKWRNMERKGEDKED